MIASTELFDPIRTDSVTDIVVQQIEGMILQGILHEDSRLPSERELAERLSVSRPKVREALKQLEDAGLLRVVHGDGTFVAPLTGQAMAPALIDLYARHGEAFYDYLEYRRAQERFAARLAAHRATPSDRAAIEALIEALEDSHARDDQERSTEADVQFHQAIVNASHNTLLIHMMTSIYDLTRRGVFYNRAHLRHLDGTGDRLLAQHRAIADAVLLGDPDAAAEAVATHLDFVETTFRAADDLDRRERAASKRRRAATLAKV